MRQPTPRPADVLARLGRVGTAAELAAISGRRQLHRALDDGQVIRVSRGRYALPTMADPLLTAAQHRGVVSHLSAARLWELPVLSRDQATHLIVPPSRNRRRGTATLHWMRLSEDEVVHGVTSPLRTVLDCARVLPFAEALAVADAALRLRLVGRVELAHAAEGLRGNGARRARLVASAGDGRSGSGLESVLRATLLQNRIRCFVPQLQIADDAFSARVDLGDPLHRIVLEADSFEHHGTRPDLVRDCLRYDELVVRGWLVLRFAWEHVMFEPEWVIDMVRGALRLRSPAYRPTMPVAFRQAQTA
jgi:very-short-patch-repair endonuclease